MVRINLLFFLSFIIYHTWGPWNFFPCLANWLVIRAIGHRSSCLMWCPCELAPVSLSISSDWWKMNTLVMSKRTHVLASSFKTSAGAVFALTGQTKLGLFYLKGLECFFLCRSSISSSSSVVVFQSSHLMFLLNVLPLWAINTRESL